ncbi:MAG: ABC transporter ATP-binding protein [Promethearchaeota archaeon]|nr:MAG: ABC transporter ATP-binding protein [Candidatus Lokiarchaeota archaeon]
MPHITLDGVTKQFNDGAVIAVNNVNLTINDGDFVFLLGPSGCGKTSLLRIISGLLQPTQGRVLIDGVDVTNNPPQTRGIAFVFQNFNIFPRTVWDNCTYALEVQDYPHDYIIEQGERALKIVGLADRADEYPIGWGNGDLQRLGIARAICSGARILIMDEPLGSLDPKISAEFRWELRHIIKDTHLTAIQVTHNQEEAMAIGDRIIIMRDGQLLQEDKPETLYKSPLSLFVGNFLGGINILEGYVTHIDPPDLYQVKIRLGGPKYTIFANYTRFFLDENVVIAFRPEDVYLFPLKYDYANSQADWTGIILSDATIISRYHTGKERRFIVELDNGDQIEVAKPETFKYRFTLPEQIQIGIFMEDIRIFKYPKNLTQEMDLQ